MLICTKSSYQGILQRGDQINSSEQWHSHTKALACATGILSFAKKKF